MKNILDRIYVGNEDSFYNVIMQKIFSEETISIVTVNSEHLQDSNESLKPYYLANSTILVADGIAITLLAKRKTNKNIHKITGVSISKFLLEVANERKLSVGVLGASEESLNLFRNYVETNYPQIETLVCTNGYVEDKDAVLQSFAQQRIDIVLVALGVPQQEHLIMKNQDYFNQSILVGVGGSIDVIGGYKKRAPRFFLETNTEWLYRIVSEPHRLRRFVSSNFSVFYSSFFKKK